MPDFDSYEINLMVEEEIPLNLTITKLSTINKEINKLEKILCDVYGNSDKKRDLTKITLDLLYKLRTDLENHKIKLEGETKEA